MKNIMAYIIVVIICLTMFTGCNQYSSKETDIQNDNQLINVGIEGGFVATVRGIIPDYCLDDKTPQVLILTEFQSGPFLVYAGQDISEKIYIGDMYYFEIVNKDVGFVTQDEYNKGIPVTETAIVLYNLRINSFRQPEDNEIGFESPSLSYYKVGE